MALKCGACSWQPMRQQAEAAPAVRPSSCTSVDVKCNDDDDDDLSFLRQLLGVRQGTGDAGTKATVQIDLGRGLKLQGEVGTSSGAPSATGSGGNGNSVGLVWSREW